MTINQMAHHAEQMEAMRRDFREQFPKFYQRMLDMNIHLSQPAAEHLCWMVWLEARKAR